MLSSFYYKSVQIYKPFLLFVGKYTYRDYLRYGCFKNRALYCAYMLPFDGKKFIYNFIKQKYDNIRENLHIITGGNLVSEKSVQHALKLIMYFEIIGLKMTVTIIGDGPEKNKLVLYQKQLDLRSNIYWVGTIPFEEYNNLMRESHFYICTGGEYEGFNCSVQNAIENGAFVVINTKNSVTYTIDDTVFFSFNEDDDNSFISCAKNVSEHINNPNLMELALKNRDIY